MYGLYGGVCVFVLYAIECLLRKTDEKTNQRGKTNRTKPIQIKQKNMSIEIKAPI